MTKHVQRCEAMIKDLIVEYSVGENFLYFFGENAKCEERPYIYCQMPVYRCNPKHAAGYMHASKHDLFAEFAQQGQKNF